MYCSWFGLTRPLFLPTNVIHTRISRYDEYCALILTRLQLEGGIWLYGESGCGKSSLLSVCSSALPGSIYIVISPSLTPSQCTYTLTGLSMDAAELARYYAGDATHGQRIVFLVDDAHLMTDEMGLWLQSLIAALQQLKMQVSFVMAGGTAETCKLSVINAKIHTRLNVPPLSLNECEELIRREEFHGQRESRIFTRAAMKYLWKASKGVPRQLILLADCAMHSAAMHQHPRVTCKDCRYAESDVTGRSPFRRIRVAMLSAFFTITLMISYFFTPILLGRVPALDVVDRIEKAKEIELVDSLFVEPETDESVLAQYLKIWGYGNDPDISGCEEVYLANVKCIRGKTTIIEINERNLPWIAILNSGNKSIRVSVVRMGPGTVDFISKNTTWTASLTWFNSHWKGDYELLMPITPTGKTQITSRSSVEDKKWLLTVMGRASGEKLTIKKNSSLPALISKFQQSIDMEATGVADETTLIRLFQKADMAPVLLKEVLNKV